jgi:hypothetical protein
MISQSRKKHRITARRSTRAIRISLANHSETYLPLSSLLPRLRRSTNRSFDPPACTRQDAFPQPNANHAGGRPAAPAVQQAQFQLPSGSAAPQPIPDTLQSPPATDTPLPDFFADPFGDFPVPPAATPQIQLPELPPAAIQSPDAPNDLRQPTVPQPAVPQPVPIVPEIDDEPMQLQPAPQADAPPRRQIEDFSSVPAAKTPLIRPVAYSCDDFRRSIADATIQKVSLDISPPFRPDVIE